MLHIDFETRSPVDLKKEGVYKYAMHPETQVLMMAYASDDEPVKVWLPTDGPIPPVVWSAGNIAAHNATFERLIMTHVLEGFVVEPEDFYCTATQARANNLPGALADCAFALGAKHQKNTDGMRLIRLFCIPPYATPESHPADWQKLVEYCKQDVETERAVHKIMRPLTDTELEQYHVSERINDRGIKVDVEFAKRAITLAEDEQDDLLYKMQNVTNNTVRKLRGTFTTQYVYDNVKLHQQYMMHRPDTDNPSLATDVRKRLLECEDLDNHMREVVTIIDEAQAPSVSKYKSMIRRASEDNRVRGAYIFNGAPATGRYSSTGLQIHNFPRGCFGEEQADKVAHDLAGAAGDGTAMETLKKMLRPSLIADEGKTFVCGDWAQIEGRVLPWLALGDEHTATAQDKLDVYADDNRDIYCETASAILSRNITPDDPERQSHGKVPELALGFGGGAGALMRMAQLYHVKMDEHEAWNIVKRWRHENAWAGDFWYGAQKAAMRAASNPGTVYSAGKLRFMRQGSVLYNLLPSGRLLAYQDIRMIVGELQTDLSALKANHRPKKDDKEWPRNNLWHGVLVENAVQAVAADILRQTMTRLHKAAYTIVGHTHDEILLEVNAHAAKGTEDMLQENMNEGFEWTKGLPLAVETWTGRRYRK